VFLGILVGVLPGLGAPNGVTLLMPLTFAMNPVSAIILLTSMYWGALFGGSTTSILFNIPGEPSSVATTFDGYPMAKAGRATEALTFAFMSSGFGALFGVAAVTLLSSWATRFLVSQSSTRSSCWRSGFVPSAAVLSKTLSICIGFAFAASGWTRVGS
jgi:TctA family transporter